ncbi:threonylcarbamoyl-AMP synthase [Candidatus Woesebacteria bacterium]|nr:threonylcarbamoyl-AMP synthase [Candidatus Woesebacteria bacterium]
MKTKLHEALKVLKNGGLVIVPSDTVYGVAVDATNENAVKKLIEFKSRPPGKAISVFCGSIERLQEYVEVSGSQENIINELLPGPYTLVLTSKHKVSSLLEAENGTLGVRVPQADFVNELVNAFDRPITATSANRAGQSPHYSVEALLNSLSEEKKKLIDYIVDAGKLPQRKPSTVVDMTSDSLEILREGDFSAFLQPPHKQEEFDSNSEEETQKIAYRIIEENYTFAKEKPLVFIFTGTLGAGKTVFTKSIATFLGIDNVVSPTYVIYYEYEAKKEPVKNFIHIDLFNVKEESEFKHLGLNEFYKSGNILSIEWGEKSGFLLKELQNISNCIQIDIKYTSSSSRHITVKTYFV